MSEVKVNSIKGVGASVAAISIDNADGTCTANITNNLSNRNKVINGAMQVAQRASSVSGITSGDYYVCDRWKLGYGTAGTWTLSKSTDTPNNFGSSFKFDCTTANGSLSAGSNLQLIQYFEGQNLQDIQKGTSTAKEVTVSFYVKTNKTGTYIVELLDQDNSNRHCSKSYTVSDTNWNRYTLTFPADTTGTLDNDNAASLEVGFWLAAGSTFSSGSLQTSWGALSQSTRAVGQVNLADNTSNEWYITGVQLEVGSTATDFEHRSFAQELALCRRYCQVYLNPKLKGVLAGSNQFQRMGMTFLETMRADPTASWSGTQKVYAGSDTASITGINVSYPDPNSYEFDATTSGTLSGGAGSAVLAYTGNSEGTLTLSAEL
tara:strand:- start:173 stop:1300 length:1128 start_codon:yes stop_codon:yes gene_type:complete